VLWLLGRFDLSLAATRIYRASLSSVALRSPRALISIFVKELILLGSSVAAKARLTYKMTGHIMSIW
jgi:hypothetical protein